MPTPHGSCGRTESMGRPFLAQPGKSTAESVPRWTRHFSLFVAQVVLSSILPSSGMRQQAESSMGSKSFA